MSLRLNLAWKTEFEQEATKEFRKLDKSAQRQIRNYLRRLEQEDDPRWRGRALTGELAGLWRYRVGDFRLLCQLEEERLVVLVLRLGHRRTVYR